jgi:hypothetical protein
MEAEPAAELIANDPHAFEFEGVEPRERVLKSSPVL